MGRPARHWKPRLIRKIDITPGFGPEGTCFRWTGTTNPDGRYGLFFRQDSVPKVMMAHRVVWEFFYGPIPPNMQVCHRCDNKLCVNPTHFFLGSVADNAADRNAKGRQASGTKQPQAKLKEADIPVICQLFADGTSMRNIAKLYGVSTVLIHRIIRRRAWKHVKL